MLSRAVREGDAITPDFWDDLVELCRVSRLVLVALEADDVETAVEHGERSAELHARVRPVVERLAAAGPLDEASADLPAMLRQIATMNDRITEVLVERKAASARAIEDAGAARIRLSWHRGRAVAEPSLIDRVS